MPATSASTTPVYHCYRCGKDKPAETGFYHRSDGSIISGCKDCHRAMAEARRGRKATGAPTTGGAAFPLGVVENARPAPAVVQYRCEGCGRASMSASPDGPRGWRRVRLTSSDEPATLCTRCTAGVQRALRVMEAVAERRRGGRGRAH
jgi:hypothetical protein